MNSPWDFNALQSRIEGEVMTDLSSRRMYATDASIYEALPAAVVRPKHVADCVSLVRFAGQRGLPLIPRAGGTSLAGQCVGNGIVVDVSRHMTKVLDVDAEQRRVTVQPGVILDQLNGKLAASGLKFAPDTSTSNRCMIGGMIGNNAAGAFSILYGTTRQHVIEIEAVLSDGSVAVFSPLSKAELQEKLELLGQEGDIYRCLVGLVESHRDLILKQYPKPEIVRRNMGYPLDYLANSQPWDAGGPAFNLAPFLCGTEGTLALMTKAVLGIVPVVRFRILVCVHFRTLDEAMRGVVAILKYEPAAVELMDKRILDLASGNLEQGRNRFWIDGDPAAVLVTEFFADSQDELTAKTERLIQALRSQRLGYAYPVISGADIPRVWEVRKAGLGLLMGLNSSRKPVTVIEDAAVSPVDLPDFVKDVQAMMRNYEAECVYYGHASVGLLHLRPELELGDENDRRKFNAIAQDFAALVERYRGALSGEHGDGRIRGPFVRKVLGDEVYALLSEVKHVFDPDGIFNPGKILTEIPIDSGLRSSHALPVDMVTGFDWTAGRGLLAATEKCNGAGVCRKISRKGTMCPSYQATREELYSTRGRANLIRYALLDKGFPGSLDSSGLHESLELCLACKGCKSECPSNVDISRLKSEVLYLNQQRHGLSFKTRMLRSYPAALRLASKIPFIANRLLNFGLLTRVLGTERELPRIANESMPKWWLKHASGLDENNSARKVILFCDVYTQYLEPGVGIAAVRVIEALGFEVVPYFLEHSPRLLISVGLLDEAKACLRNIVRRLHQELSSGAQACVGLEPSELLVLRDEALDLVGEDLLDEAKKVAAFACLFEGFVLGASQSSEESSEIFRKQGPKVAVHIHCHEKSLLGSGPMLDMLRELVDGDARVLNTGCCGMAGHFGYSHPELSRKVAMEALLPELATLPDDVVVVASGTSCRAQIREIGHRPAVHSAEVLNMKLNQKVMYEQN